ncbi:phosphatidylserine decarboxylase [Pseudenhygromyxa sp. WMMC2535]|uniref:phosphatidylserine decarboxylase n=1 Tax=Pseudenhygromyxa sp. WMMC2535 TaxID=2712867 RepID=UPI001556E5C7|nr:phosphatidylserine decarboxylase [Pseudenhygromyxa sp. WMMC2535]NVB36448.1 phosphatidylserine decarboxylase [Pseudenhygromyxa sp. WMMC2535]
MTTNLSSNPAVACLQVLVQSHKGFPLLLESSLRVARSKAAEQLDPKLFAALKWPVTYGEYLAYLEWFACWPPVESSDPAWLEPGTQEHQEVYDRLCHFYYLIDQPVDGGKIVESVGWFSEWLVAYADAWGDFLDTTASFSPAQLASFLENSPRYEVRNSMIGDRPNSPSGWLTFNQFFARELNPGLRPIAEPMNNAVAVCPADCTYKAKYHIGPNSEIDAIRVKGTHSYANVEQLLEGSRYAGAFANGTFVHYFLGPYSYHRFHTPVAGRVVESYAISGKVYLDVDINSGQFDAPDSAQGGYEFNQARGVLTIDTAGSPYGDLGVVAVVPVGMAQVSSVRMTATPDTSCLKGDEFGYFVFGGSDIIVLFQHQTHPEIDKNTDYRRYGTPIASCKTAS